MVAYRCEGLAKARQHVKLAAGAAVDLAKLAVENGLADEGEDQDVGRNSPGLVGNAVCIGQGLLRARVTDAGAPGIVPQSSAGEAPGPLRAAAAASAWRTGPAPPRSR